MSNVTRCTIHVENFYEKQEYIFEEIDHNIFSIPSFIRQWVSGILNPYLKKENTIIFFIWSVLQGIGCTMFHHQIRSRSNRNGIFVPSSQGLFPTISNQYANKIVYLW